MVIPYSSIKKLVQSLNDSAIPQGWGSLLRAINFGNSYVICFQINSEKLFMESKRL